MKYRIQGIAAAAVLYALSGSAIAATVQCPDGSGNPPNGTRYISVTTDAASDSGFADCLAYGTGNIPSTGNLSLTAGDSEPSYEVTFARGTPLVLDNFVGTYDVSSGNGLAGLLTFSGGLITLSSAFADYTDLQLLIKTGNANRNPDWAVFNLTGGDLTIWASVNPPQGGGISHISIFGTPTTSVPEPATLGLLGLGLLGVGLARRRKTA